MPLEEYESKRHFDVTPEPAGGAPSLPGRPLRFVVHKHAARALHYDFRLELDGVLLSWAVPKGPSYDPKDKRLAVHVEDHPLDYGDFEGTIPAGEYGAGSVIIWDRGTWEPVAPAGGEPDAHAGLAKGDFKFRLSGEKLIGNWVLVRLKPRPGEKRDNWLLIKERDEHVRDGDGAAILVERPESVASGLTVEQMAEGISASRDRQVQPEGGASPGEGVDPMIAPPDLALCTLVTEPPRGDDWLVEVKYDGFRISVALDHGVARVFERGGGDATERYPSIARAASSLPATTALLDGEAVVLDETGVSRFGLLIDALSSAPERVSMMAFDLLYLNGHDLRAHPTTTRRELLATLLDEPTGPSIRLAAHVRGDAAAFLEAACAQGLEGLVAKRADAPYPAGRSRRWLKVKCRRTREFLVVGATRPRSGRKGFGALLLAYYGEDGSLCYAGRVGSGLSATEMEGIEERLRALAITEPPVEEKTRRGVAPVERWFRPELVVEVAFAEWTPDGRLRQPSFLRVRDDIAPRDVIRVVAEAPPETESVEAGAPAVGKKGADASVIAGVRITNPGKRLFPDSDLTKLELARYYEAIAPRMLVEAAERPLTLVRCPVGDGHRGGCFYQRHPERGLPQSVTAFSHRLAGHDEPDEWISIGDVSGLVSLAQMGCAEIHSWLSRTDAPGRPDRIVFDLDPGPGVEWAQISRAAHRLRDELDALGLAVFVKSTGSKGLHVTSPIEPVWEFARVHEMTRSIAERLAERYPDELTARIAKSKRDGRIFLDYVRNSEAASAVLPYSTRFLPGPTVALPLAFEELDDFDPQAVTPAFALQRLTDNGDPWRDLPDSAVGSRVLKAAEGRLF